VKPTYRVKFRRGREGKTDYRKRLELLKSGKPRAVVRRLNRQTIVQIIEYHPEGDKTVVGVSSKALEKYGWISSGNTPTAYLTGLLCGLKAKEKGITEAVLDIGRHDKRNKGVFAALKGLLDAGINIPHNPDIIPPEDRISGKIIAEYAKSLNNFEKQFSEYMRKGFDPREMDKKFEEVKEKILQEFGGN
jgi:large subunit ribosomal protein L18